MLHLVLRMVENAQGPITLNELSYKLMVEPAVLESMIQFWVRKGRLVDEDAVGMGSGAACSTGSCGGSCTGAASCAFVAKMPKSYSIKLK
jgi:hypothetical protein